MRKAELFPPAAGAVRLKEQPLIPEETIFSNLLEGLRLERASYKILGPGDIPCGARTDIDELHGFFFQTGQARFSFQDEQPVQAQRMDYVLISHNMKYSVDSVAEHGPCSLVLNIFKLDNAVGRLLLRLLPSVLTIRNMSQEEYDWHADIGKVVISHPKCIEAASPAVNHRLIEASLISIIQSWLHSNPPPGLLFDNPASIRIFPSLRAMHRDPEKAWTMASLTALSGMSRTSFANTFQSVTGETVARYLTTLRLDKSRELLKLKQLSLSDIAQRSGFAANTAFIRAFKRQFGVTPGKFRGTGISEEDRAD